MIKERNLVMTILLSFITFIFYDIYWINEITKDIDLLSNSKEEHNGFMIIMLSIVTFGLYFVYFNYKMGKNLEKMNEEMGIKGSSNSILFAFLALIPFGYKANLGIAQNDVNEHIRKYSM